MTTWYWFSWLINGGNLALTEGPIERCVNRVRLNTEARGRVAINHHSSFEASILLIGIDVLELAKLSQFREDAGGPLV